MEIISKEVYPDRDYNSLYDFFQYCQKIAREKAQVQFASIGLKTKYLDPLAVLKSIYESKKLSFYFEHPSSNFAMAGVDAAIQGKFEGPQRFTQVRDFSKKVLENTIAMGDFDIPFLGPHFFSSFTFYDETPPHSSFPAAQVFLPYWQFTRSNSVCSAIANIPVAPESNIHFLVQKLCATHQKLSSFDYFEFPTTEATGNASFIELGGHAWYENAVRTAMANLESGSFEKIVIARQFDIENDKPFDILGSLNRLRKAFPLCFSCLVTNGQGQSFSAITPETLLRIEKGRAKTEALAGSISRGNSAAEDALLGNMLLENDKDLREHRFVVDSIVNRLLSLGIIPEHKYKPNLKKLANIQHLCTIIEANVPADLHFLDLASILHPTPAVCGTPLNASRQAIAKIENFDRGLYAGAIGWFDHQGDGELVVGIRSALIDGHKARLYSGSGIVKGSDPDIERRETDIKLQAILQNLR